jgi:4-amino-4-deoxy-L-arabinose transferase-like glycosyltransferase
MRMFRALGTVQLILFLIIAAVVAYVIAKILGFLLSIFFAVLGYAVAFVIAVILLMWIWQKVTGNGRRSVDHTYDDRTPDGRRRY